MNNDKERDMGRVVKTNRLNTAIQNLSLAEIRLIQVAIIDSRETQTGLADNTPLRVSALRYAKAFDIEPQTAYEALIGAEKTLFDRRFTFLNDRQNEVKSRWISDVEYLKGEGAIALTLSRVVVNEITRINGLEQFFTQYTLEQTAQLKSVYSVRLYELLVQWKKAKKTPVFEIDIFRGQLGVGVNEYKRMSDFKKRVLDLAINEVNKKTDLTVSYEQVKAGVSIKGFKFKLSLKDTNKNKQEHTRDADTGDMFTTGSLSDKQLIRIARNPKFVSDYNHLVSATSAAGQNMDAWTHEMVNRLKKLPSQFDKRPIRHYLD